MQNIIKHAILLLALCITSGCAVQAPETRTPLNLPSPAQLKMKPVQWKVLKQDPPILAADKSVVIIGITEEGYKNLAQNFRDIINYMSTQRKIIETYKKYHEAESK
jgi:hypothetical protein